MTASPKSVKITVVGDGLVGKTSLLISNSRGEFLQEWFLPKIMLDDNKHTTVDGQLYSIEYCDSIGQYEDYKVLRPLSYPRTTCFLVCYSVCGRASFENVATKWISEVRQHMPHTPIILVATKVDLRDDHIKDTISKTEGKKLKRRIKADTFIECSAKNGINVSEVFEEAVRWSVKENTSYAKKRCTIL